MFCLVCAPVIPLIKIVSIRAMLSASPAEEVAPLLERYVDIKYFYASNLAVSVYFLIVLIGIGVSWFIYRRTVGLR